MELAAKLDQFGKGSWIALTVLGFWLFWPVGLAVLAFSIASGRLGRRSFDLRGQWYNMAQSPESGGKPAGSGWGPWGCGAQARRPSGNKAFDDYRADTLRRLEEEQQEFHAYLERLRQARDKQEFDQFMADRRNRNGGPVTAPTVPGDTP